MGTAKEERIFIKTLKESAGKLGNILRQDRNNWQDRVDRVPVHVSSTLSRTSQKTKTLTESVDSQPLRNNTCTFCLFCPRRINAG